MTRLNQALDELAENPGQLGARSALVGGLAQAAPAGRVSVSSGLTWVFKVMFPLVWIGGFAVVTVAEFLVGDAMAPGFFLATVVGGALLGSLGWKLKWVEVDAEYVYVSGIRRRIAVSLSEVVSVQQKFDLNIKPAFIVFRERTAFGSSIMFMALRTAGPFREDAVIDWLRKRAGFSEEWRPEEGEAGP